MGADKDTAVEPWRPPSFFTCGDGAAGLSFEVCTPILSYPMFGGAQLSLLPLQSYITCMRALEWLQWFVEI